MKKILILFASFLVLSFVACNQQNAQTEDAKSGVLKTMVANIAVEGMTCTGCENTVMNKVKAVDGVIEVNASHVDKQAVVKFDASKTSVDAIKEAINKSGYEALDYTVSEQ